MFGRLKRKSSKAQPELSAKPNNPPPGESAANADVAPEQSPAEESAKSSQLAQSVLGSEVSTIATPPPAQPRKIARKQAPQKRIYKSSQDSGTQPVNAATAPPPQPAPAETRSYKPKPAVQPPPQPAKPTPVSRSYKATTTSASPPLEPSQDQKQNPLPKQPVIKTQNTKTMALADTLRTILTDLRSALPETEGSIIASTDGLPIAHALPSEKDAEKLAAMVATGIGLGRRIAMTFDCGNFSETVVAGTSGSVYLYAAGDKAVLAVNSRKGANVGLINIEARDAAKKVAELL